MIPHRLLFASLAVVLVSYGAARGVPAPHAEKLITAEGLSTHIQVLASDAFEGRAPATRGEELTVTYLRDQFASLGLRPGNHGDWFQTVPLVKITPDPSTRLHITGGAAPFDLASTEDVVVWNRRLTEWVSLTESEFVFVGYGVSAPEVGWDDFKGLDLRGKTLVVLVNDPDHGLESGDFLGRRMTYYGRWSYKYEEAMRRGAAGVLIVHEDAPAGYPWGVVVGSWADHPRFDIPPAPGSPERLALEGWITRDATGRLFSAAGLDFATLKERARRKDFQPVPLGLKASTQMYHSLATSQSRNVLGLLPGRQRPEEVVIYMAHWDHLGKNDSLPGDKIFNGAVDNATGTAALLELAKAFTALNPAPKRSILFLAVTAEESGFWGSWYYTQHPVFPLAQTVAGINFDILNVSGPTRDVVVVNRGASELEDFLEDVTGPEQRYLTEEDAPEQGFFYRSDHISFAKVGVPVIYTKSGVDLVRGGIAAGQAAVRRYTQNDYHKVTDEFRPEWDLTGMAQDVRLFFEVGRRLADSHEWPNWREGNEFRPIRDASRGE
ncbi:M28 family metallopeptidase [Archangium sp.]|uniref:M28 family metallopeptidase n=1 Tax=Archangium sp. TaxID=1872627 RepID=UPI002EDB0CBD